MGILRFINEVLRKFERFVVSAGILLIGFLTIINVIARTVFNHSLSFAQEINSFAIIMVTFLGTAYAARQGRHIRMSALFDAMPKKYKKVMIYIMTGLSSIILFYLTKLSGEYVINVYHHHRVSSVLTIPLWIIFIWMPIGLCIAAVQYAMAFIKNLKEEDVWISFDEKTEYADIDAEIEEVTEVPALEEIEFEEEEEEQDIT